MPWTTFGEFHVNPKIKGGYHNQSTMFLVVGSFLVINLSSAKRNLSSFAERNGLL